MNVCRLNKEDFEKIELYRGNKETVLFHYNEPEPGLFIAEGPTVFSIALANNYETLSVICTEKMLESELFKRLSADVPVYVVDKREAEEYLGYIFAGEISALMKRKKQRVIFDLIGHDGGPDFQRVLVLERVENPINVGAMFRTAAAMNFDAVLLSPGCADPLYRRSIRVATGNTLQLNWSYVGETEAEWQENGIAMLKEMGFTTVALALRSDNIDIEDPRLQECKKLAVIMGNEGHGLCEKTIENCDYVAKIAMREGVDSLNVGAAAAIAMYVLGKR